jgi:heptosyltransferase-2
MSLPERKPRLLVIELWQLGDLVIATPFLRAATEKYDVTVLAKPFAFDLQSRLWPGVKVLPFVAPWTAFRGKYRLLTWPWKEMFRLGRSIRAARFDLGLSARPGDPRDHFLLTFARAKTRFGFPRFGSQVFLNHPLQSAEPEAHRYEYWQVSGRAMGLDLPPRDRIPFPLRQCSEPGKILVHTGARASVRVWPLENYRKLVQRLRQKMYSVEVACDPDQRDWWLKAGESGVTTPRTVAELLAAIDRATALVGNDSGPGHVAAFLGVPAFTIFGPQLPEWFAPLHPAAEWIEGKACPYKPCKDYCRFASPLCIERVAEQEVWMRIEPFVARNCSGQLATSRIT